MMKSVGVQGLSGDEMVGKTFWGDAVSNVGREVNVTS
jgi:hypothetical protein